MESNIDTRIRRTLMPTRVLWHSDNATNSEILTKNNWGQAIEKNMPCCTLNGKGAGVLLDFGRELNGSLQLVIGPIGGNRNVRARVRFGESASEAMGDPNTDHANHDFEILLAPMSSQQYGLSGFRFARIDLIDDVQVPLIVTRAITLEHEPPEIGHFVCSDKRLNDIWSAGRQTVRLCMQDHIWDGIKRDRLVWLGDMHPEVSVILRCFGALDIVPSSLDWARDHFPLPGWMNGMLPYSMWWVILQHDWWMQTADKKYLAEQQEYLRGLLQEFLKQIGDDGKVNWRGGLFLDWPSSPNASAVAAGSHALLVWCLTDGAKLCDVLGEKALANTCRERAALLRKVAPALPPTSEASQQGSKQAAALLVLADMADAKKANEQVLSQSPLKGQSTFYGFYALEAQALAGDMTGALNVIRNYWGGMLDLGATSFWEHFELSWAENAGRIDELPVAGKKDVHREYGDYCYIGYRHSFCHGWAAGPTAFLSSTVLGVQFLEPGGKKVSILPQLGDLQWAEGDIPTAHGPIHVRHEKNARGEIITRHHAPQGVSVKVLKAK
ncbi:alpha-L-rhamnosidase [bacterium]|nr:MAG: alpha-L-rhamnosidase [bacterium]